MMSEKQKYNLSILLFIFFFAIAVINFLFGGDPNGSGGSINDFTNTWPYVESLSKTFPSLHSLYGDGPRDTDNTPLGYILLSWFFLILKDQYLVRITYFVFSFISLIVFYVAIKEKYPNIKKANLIILVTIFMAMPAFISGSTWANNSILANIFFILFIIYFNRWLKEKKTNRFNKTIFYQILFLALAVYTRQYYALFFIFLIYNYFYRLTVKEFFLTMFVIFLFTLPGFYIIVQDIRVLKTVSTFKIYNTFLISPSIMLFYLIPIYFLSYMQNKKNIISLLPDSNSNKTIILWLIFITLFLSFIFDYNFKIGGGIFFKASQILLKNNLIGYFAGGLGLYILFLLSRVSNSNKILIILLVAGFPSYYIFQKYFEPMFFIIILLMLDQKKIIEINKSFNSLLFLLLYYSVYLCLTISNDIFKISKLLN